MSASTRTIQQPISTGSNIRTVAMAAVVLATALTIGWGATNLIGTKSVATPVQAPLMLDMGSRGELAAPQPGAAPVSILDQGGRTDLRGSSFNPNGDRLKDDNVFGASSAGASSVGASSASHPTRTSANSASGPTGHSGFRAQ